MGVGISEVGMKTSHSIELSPAYAELFEDNGIGKVTTFIHDTHRFPSEDAEAESDPFRAWMAERLNTAIDVAEGGSNLVWFMPVRKRPRVHGAASRKALVWHPLWEVTPHGIECGSTLSARD